ncbi:MAG TPA: site-2 protease family protein [Verrucomicrobiae bacterium]|nr:site-2 protease family protein [Verrucomicrobiae bacterium]
MDISYILTVLAVILLSMTLHEAMHAFASYWLGDDTARLEGRLTLNPIAHIDPFMTILLPILLAISGGPIFGGAKPVPFNPMRVRFGEVGAALVGLAGPLTNLALSFIAFAVYALGGAESAMADFLRIAVTVNLGFFIFNMIPIPPLDGSRLLYAIAPDSVRRVMAQMEQYGIIIIFAIVLLFNAQLGMAMEAAMNFFLSIYGTLFGLEV